MCSSLRPIKDKTDSDFLLSGLEDEVVPREKGIKLLKLFDFFRKRTEEIAHESHPLVVLAKAIDWDSFNKSFGEKFHPDKSRHGLSTHLMVGLHYIILILFEFLGF